MKNSYFSSSLRQELAARNRAFAKRHALLHTESYGSDPVVVYEPSDTQITHGNFLQPSYEQIRTHPDWLKRLGKIHPQARTALPRKDRRWCELDSCMSSDALLMNIFCHPGTLNPATRRMLGVDETADPEFGVNPRVPLTNGSGDRTEIDMRLGELLVESKLTEADFQSKSKEVLETYRDFREVFDRRLLPQTRGAHDGYQLIRNILAAFALNARFCVLLDARRSDLIEQAYAVIRAVKPADLRVRCSLLTWQELSTVLPDELRNFLDEKYGIVPPGNLPSSLPTLDQL